MMGTRRFRVRPSAVAKRFQQRQRSGQCPDLKRLDVGLRHSNPLGEPTLGQG